MDAILFIVSIIGLIGALDGYLHYQRWRRRPKTDQRPRLRAPEPVPELLPPEFTEEDQP